MSEDRTAPNSSLPQNLDTIQWLSVSTLAKHSDMSTDGLVHWAAKVASQYIKENWLEASQSGDPHWLDNLLEKATKEHTRIRDRSAAIGQEVDRAIGDWLSDEILTPSFEHEESYACWEAWESFVEDHKVELIAGQFTMINPEVGWKGTPDYFIMKDDVPTLMSLKTTSAIRQSSWFQDAMYARGIVDLRPDLPYPEKIIVLRLDRDGHGYEIKDITKGWERRADAMDLCAAAEYTARDKRLKGNPIVAEMKERYK